eukprot:4950068-Pyramimonas_sp.AAC.1
MPSAPRRYTSALCQENAHRHKSSPADAFALSWDAHLPLSNALRSGLLLTCPRAGKVRLSLK